MNNEELVHYICNKISQMDEVAHYVYKDGIIYKYIKSDIVDSVNVEI